jgi:hypothetical protein
MLARDDLRRCPFVVGINKSSVFPAGNIDFLIGIISLIKEGKMDEGLALAKEVYKDNKEGLLIFTDLVEKYYDGKPVDDILADTPLLSLTIQDDWTWESDGSYSYIKGRVKNVGNKNIRYFEVHAEYMDLGNQILDTDYTNSGEIIKPNAMKEFEIMHKHNDDYKKVQIYINNVQFE